VAAFAPRHATRVRVSVRVLLIGHNRIGLIGQLPAHGGRTSGLLCSCACQFVGVYESPRVIRPLTSLLRRASLSAPTPRTNAIFPDAERKTRLPEARDALLCHAPFVCH